MVDLGRVKFELRRLASPSTVGLGALGLYDELSDVMLTFESDPDFKKILAARNEETKTSKTSKRSKLKEK
ncbi:MAG: hypothetical protein II453_07135 [Alphaproteobacteria bacterium]|nr:hypothetical protein [Alphaproteobacteria bacterium]